MHDPDRAPEQQQRQQRTLLRKLPLLEDQRDGDDHDVHVVGPGAEEALAERDHLEQEVDGEDVEDHERCDVQRVLNVVLLHREAVVPVVLAHQIRVLRFVRRQGAAVVVQAAGAVGAGGAAVACGVHDRELHRFAADTRGSDDGY